MTSSSENKEIARMNALDSLVEFGDILEYFASEGIALDDNKADAIKSISVVENKDELIGVPFLLVQWRFNAGDYGDFASAEIALPGPNGAADGRLMVLNDGSTGIAAQLANLTEHRKATGHPMPQAGRMVNGGLRRSDYKYTNEKGEETPAHTYYLVF